MTALGGVTLPSCKQFFSPSYDDSDDPPDSCAALDALMKIVGTKMTGEMSENDGDCAPVEGGEVSVKRCVGWKSLLRRDKPEMRTVKGKMRGASRRSCSGFGLGENEARIYSSNDGLRCGEDQICIPFLEEGAVFEAVSLSNAVHFVPRTKSVPPNERSVSPARPDTNA